MADFRDLEEAMSRLDSVDAVRVVTEGDRVSEVHILAQGSKPAKHVVRDVQTLAMARFGANIDRRAISIVQLAPQSLPMETKNRPALLSITNQVDEQSTTVTVTLGWQNGEHHGQSTGPISSPARLRLVGEATIDAISRMFVNLPPLALDSVGLTTIGAQTVAIAVVVGATVYPGELSVGSALVADDEPAAAAKAVLDALNRRLPHITISNPPTKPQSSPNHAQGPRSRT